MIMRRLTVPPESTHPFMDGNAAEYIQTNLVRLLDHLDAYGTDDPDFREGHPEGPLPGVWETRC